MPNLRLRLALCLLATACSSAAQTPDHTAPSNQKQAENQKTQQASNSTDCRADGDESNNCWDDKKGSFQLLGGVARVSQIVDYIFYVLYALLGLRFLLALLAAKSTAGFVRFIVAVTDPFYRPFRGIVASPGNDRVSFAPAPDSRLVGIAEPKACHPCIQIQHQTICLAFFASVVASIGQQAHFEQRDRLEFLVRRGKAVMLEKEVARLLDHILQGDKAALILFQALLPTNCATRWSKS